MRATSIANLAAAGDFTRLEAWHSPHSVAVVKASTYASRTVD